MNNLIGPERSDHPIGLKPTNPDPDPPVAAKLHQVSIDKSRFYPTS